MASLPTAMVSGGLGAAAATVIAAAIQTLGRRSESRATAAEIISNAAGSLAARQSEVIGSLESRVNRQAEAIIGLTSVLDELLPQVELPDGELERLSAAVKDAKRAV